MPSRYAIYVLALMFGINFLNYMDRWVGSAVAPLIQAGVRPFGLQHWLARQRVYARVRHRGSAVRTLGRPQSATDRDRHRRAQFGWRRRSSRRQGRDSRLRCLRSECGSRRRGAAEPEGPHLHVVLSQTALFFVLGADAYWLPTLLNRRFGMSVGEAGTLAGGVIVVGGLVGTLLGGWVADWRRKARHERTSRSRSSDSSRPHWRREPSARFTPNGEHGS